MGVVCILLGITKITGSISLMIVEIVIGLLILIGGALKSYKVTVFGVIFAVLTMI